MPRVDEVARYFGVYQNLKSESVVVQDEFKLRSLINILKNIDIQPEFDQVNSSEIDAIASNKPQASSNSDDMDSSSSSTNSWSKLAELDSSVNTLEGSINTFARK